MRGLGVAGITGSALLLAVLGFGLTVDPDDLGSPMVGHPAPDLTLPTLSGSELVHLGDLEGRVLVLNFWASWCVPCIQEHEVLVEAWRAYSDRGVDLVGVLYQDTPERAEQFLREHGGGWLQVHDEDSRAAIEYGVFGVPETFVIDETGTIVFKKVGPLEGSELIDEIERWRAGGPTE